MKKNILFKIALLSPALVIVSGGSIAANIPAISKSFPEIPISFIEMLTTIPSLFIIIAVMLSNVIARYIGVKNTILTGLLFVFFSGITPIFVYNFWVIFASRALFGIGIGLFNSLLIGAISYFFEGNERSTLIGFESSFEGIGGMALTFTVGQLLLINWQTSFWIYSIAFPIFLIFALLIPKIDSDKMFVKKAATKKMVETGDDISILQIIGYMSLLFIVAIMYMSITLKITGLITVSGYGSPTDGSTILALVGVGAMTAGFIFGRIVGITKQHTLTLSLLLLGFSMFLISLSNSVLLTGIAALLSGFAFRTLFPYLLNKVNQVPSKNTNLFNSLILVAFNIGVAFSPFGLAFITTVTNGEPRELFLLESGILLGFSVVGFAYSTGINFKNKRVAIESVND